MKFELKVNQQIFSNFPDYQALIIYAENIKNGESDQFSRQVLQEAETESRTIFKEIDLALHPHIAAWRDAFRDFGAKPKRHFCGAEALLRRVLTGESIKPVNQLVDIYNAVSIRYVIPVGGEDWDHLHSDLYLSESTGKEPFEIINFGDKEITYPEKGEIIWADQTGCTVRRWNWRQTMRTAITVQTRNCYFVLDRLAPLKLSDLHSAGEFLRRSLIKMCPDAEVTAVLISKS